MHDVTYKLTLRRRSIMLFYYLYFPNILINIIATFQFLLPCDSTEKVTLGITILLAMIVYLLLMEEMLPQTEDVPIIGEFTGDPFAYLSFTQRCMLHLLACLVGDWFWKFTLGSLMWSSLLQCITSRTIDVCFAVYYVCYTHMSVTSVLRP